MLKIEIKKLKNLVDRQQKEINQLLSMVDYDFLTKLYNRQGFIKETEKFLAEIKESKKGKERRKISIKNFSLIFIDLNGFKIINDKFGHKVGDFVLKTVARIFKESIRDFDIIARWGGDEFVISLIGADEKDALKTAKKLRKKLESINIKGRRLNASFGIISAVNGKRDTLNLCELIEKADLAMYAAKKSRAKNFAIYINDDRRISRRFICH